MDDFLLPSLLGGVIHMQIYKLFLSHCTNAEQVHYVIFGGDVLVGSDNFSSKILGISASNSLFRFCAIFV